MMLYEEKLNVFDKFIAFSIIFEEQLNLITEYIIITDITCILLWLIKYLFSDRLYLHYQAWLIEYISL